MESAQTAETQLLRDVELLRAAHPNTQDLYREVCTVMFFRYGLTPTANRLYQLVRKGSMSAPAEALARFWEQLRERSRVTIEGPDVPETLRAGAGELVAALWQQARAAAAADHAAFRAEVEAAMAQVRDAAAAADARAAAAEEALETGRAALTASADETATVRRELAACAAENGRLRQRVEEARKELNEQHAWFRTVERDHAAAIDKLGDQLLAEQKAAETAHKHLAIELERESTTAARLQQALDGEREAAAGAGERHRAELRELLSQVAHLHQRLGTLEGSAAASGAARDHALRQLSIAQGETAAVQARAAAAEGRAAALEAALLHAKPPAPKPRRPRAD